MRRKNNVVRWLAASRANWHLNRKPRADSTLGAMLADAYDAGIHDPHNPAVVESYALFKAETLFQFWHAFFVGGIDFEPWKAGGQPYLNSAEMHEDVRNNKHLYFFLGGEMPDDHPLKALTGIKLYDTWLTFNDVFRAVHDLHGHAAEGFDFGSAGEEFAWRKHTKMYPEGARPAMTTETRGQNSWFNFGRHLRRPDGTIPAHGDSDYRYPGSRPFAPQKAFLMPPWAVELPY